MLYSLSYSLPEDITVTAAAALRAFDTLGVFSAVPVPAGDEGGGALCLSFAASGRYGPGGFPSPLSPSCSRTVWALVRPRGASGVNGAGGPMGVEWVVTWLGGGVANWLALWGLGVVRGVAEHRGSLCHCFVLFLCVEKREKKRCVGREAEVKREIGGVF